MKAVTRDYESSKATYMYIQHAQKTVAVDYFLKSIHVPLDAL